MESLEVGVERDGLGIWELHVGVSELSGVEESDGEGDDVVHLDFGELLGFIKQPLHLLVELCHLPSELLQPLFFLNVPPESLVVGEILREFFLENQSSGCVFLGEVSTDERVVVVSPTGFVELLEDELLGHDQTELDGVGLSGELRVKSKLLLILVFQVSGHVDILIDICLEVVVQDSQSLLHIHNEDHLLVHPFQDKRGDEVATQGLLMVLVAHLHLQEDGVDVLQYAMEGDGGQDTLLKKSFSVGSDG